jgi:hypothetical protein
MKTANRYVIAVLMLVAGTLQVDSILRTQIGPVALAMQLLYVAAGAGGAVAILLLRPWTPAIWRVMMVFYTAYPLLYLIVIPGAWASYAALARAVSSLPGPLAVGTFVLAVVSSAALLAFGWIIDCRLRRSSTATPRSRESFHPTNG